MEQFSIVNLNNFTWQLNIALMGGAFAVFSLIYNVHFIYYGLITFVFGVFGHALDKFLNWILRPKNNIENQYYWTVFLANIILTMLWIASALLIY